MLLLLRMGLRNVLRYRRRSVITGFAIAIAVLVMVLVRGLVNASEQMVFEQIVLGQTGALQVHKRGFVDNVNKPVMGFVFPVTEELLGKIRAVPGVVDAAARIPFATMTSLDDKTVVTPVLAIDPEHEYQVCPVKRADVRDGKPVGADSVVMSPQLRQQLGVKQDDELTLLTQDRDGVMNAGLVKASGFLSDIPLLTANKKLMFMPLPVAQQMLRTEGSALEIAVRLQDYSAPEAARDLLASALGPDYEVHTWKDRAPTVVDSMAERRVILGYVTLVFLLIALIGVTNTMLMSVLGRTREIGTMLAVGMRRRQVIALFIAEAALLGGLGSLVGVLIGEVIVFAARTKGIPLVIPGGATAFMLRPYVELSYVAQVGGLVALGSALASVYPATRAAKMKPIEAMGAL